MNFLKKLFTPWVPREKLHLHTMGGALEMKVVIEQKNEEFRWQFFPEKQEFNVHNGVIGEFFDILNRLDAYVEALNNKTIAIGSFVNIAPESEWENEIDTPI